MKAIVQARRDSREARVPSLSTGAVTLLFTDIEGFTTLLRRLGDRRYAGVLAEHRRLLREAFAEGNGQEIDTQGDVFLYSEASACRGARRK